MRKFLISAATLALMAVPALAQDHREGHPGGGGGGGARPAHAAAPAAAPRPQGNGNAMTMHHEGGNRPGGAGGRDNNRPNGGPNNGTPRPNDAHPNFHNGFNDNSHPAYNNNNNNRRPDFSRYHRTFNAPQRYRAKGNWRRPPGFQYRRWSYGQILPSIYWAQDYWLNDWNDYGLMDPPPGAVWVRYDNDAVLIDRYTGEVIQVEYNVFY